MPTSYNGSYQSENAPLFASQQQPSSLEVGASHYDDSEDRNSMESSSVSMRSVVFGALDGLTTSLAVLGAAAGSGVGSSVVLALGVGSIVADAIALGFGEYMSSKAHMTFVQAQRRHGQWEYKNYREHEIALMTKLFESKGMSKADAEVVVSTMAQYENLFVNLMITEERGLIIPRETEFELCTDAFMMFISFAFFGSVPLLCFWACEDALGTSATHAFLIAAFVALVMLAAFGCIKGSFSTGMISLGGIEPLIVGVCCSIIAFLIGSLLDEFTGGN